MEVSENKVVSEGEAITWVRRLWLTLWSYQASVSDLLWKVKTEIKDEFYFRPWSGIHFFVGKVNFPRRRRVWKLKLCTHWLEFRWCGQKELWGDSVVSDFS